MINGLGYHYINMKKEHDDFLIFKFFFEFVYYLALPF